MARCVLRLKLATKPCVRHRPSFTSSPRTPSRTRSFNWATRFVKCSTKSVPERVVPTKIREMPQDERPREKLLAHGAMALADSELIAILLRTGLPGANAVEVARQLLKRYDSLSGVSRCTVQEIAKIPGIGQAKAIQLVAAFGLGQRLANERLSRQ